jgi:hypothetical protein
LASISTPETGGRDTDGSSANGYEANVTLRCLFVDFDSFFASIEQRDDPSLRRRPIAVVPVKAETTCCLAASYEAKKLGIKTGTGIAEARESVRKSSWSWRDPPATSRCTSVSWTRSRTASRMATRHRIKARLAELGIGTRPVLKEGGRHYATRPCCPGKKKPRSRSCGVSR